MQMSKLTLVIKPCLVSRLSRELGLLLETLSKASDKLKESKRGVYPESSLSDDRP